MFKQSGSRNELSSILFGFSFILAVSALFFLKSHFSNQKKEALKITKTDEVAKNAVKNFASISVTELTGKIRAKEKMLILDARDTDSFNAEHILDAKNFSLDGLRENTHNFSSTESYVFVDDLGLTPNEIQAMQLFKDAGVSNVAYLEGGMTQWENEYAPTVSIGDPYSLADRSKVSFIKSEDLKEGILTKKSPYIIDTRSNAEYRSGHIAGAVNLPLDDIENRRHEIPVAVKIVLYDDGGVGAFQAAVRLFDAGILNAYALTDGLNDWKQKGFEVVTSN